MRLLNYEYLSYDYGNVVYMTEWYVKNVFLFSVEIYQEGDYNRSISKS